MQAEVLQDETFARYLLLLLAAACVVLLAGLARLRAATARRALPAAGARRAQDPEPVDAPVVTTSTPYADPALELLTLEVYRRAFRVGAFNQTLPEAHEEIGQRVLGRLPQLAARREFLPRMPLVIPRLLTAMKADGSSVRELVDIIVQDPLLMADVLRVANSPLCRLSGQSVDSIERAIALLGLSGLRAVVASSVLQPVFQAPRGVFDGFPEAVWALAQHAARSARAWSRATGECDEFNAHLLALLFYLSQIVLLRLALASYAEVPGLQPRAELVARLIDQQGPGLARVIAREWDMPPALQDAMAEHAERRPLELQSPLSRALYFGRSCGMGMLLAATGRLDDSLLPGVLRRKGFDGMLSLWEELLAAGLAGAEPA